MEGRPRIKKSPIRFYWYTIYDDMDKYHKKCLRCQKQSSMPTGQGNKLHLVPVPNEVMKQIGIDRSNLPEIDGYKHVVVAIDYFSKWSEEKPYYGDKRLNHIFDQRP